MAYRYSPDEAMSVLRKALDAVEPDQVYHGSMIYGRYRYYGMGNRTIEFQPAENSDPARFLERMSGQDLATAIRVEIGLAIENKNAARRAVGLPEIENDLSKESEMPYLPEGWTEASPGGLATNPDRINGGIVDKVMMSNEWFVIFNRDDLPLIDNLNSREEAFQVFAERLKQAAEAEPDSPTPGL
jgi:hypothetical protein